MNNIKVTAVVFTSMSLVTRENWGAQSVDAQSPTQQLPLTRVIVAHTVTQTCDTRADCILLTQSIQQHHIQLFGDIGYSFLVGGEGSVLEGQGWSKVGVHTYGYNRGSLGVALIGNFVSKDATQAAMTATRTLLEQGVSTGQLAPDYQLYAHCQLTAVASPGRSAFNQIKLWPNWNPENALRCLQ